MLQYLLGKQKTELLAGIEMYKYPNKLCFLLLLRPVSVPMETDYGLPKMRFDVLKSSVILTSDYYESMALCFQSRRVTLGMGKGHMAAGRQQQSR